MATQRVRPDVVTAPARVIIYAGESFVSLEGERKAGQTSWGGEDRVPARTGGYGVEGSSRQKHFIICLLWWDPGRHFRSSRSGKKAVL